MKSLEDYINEFFAHCIKVVEDYMSQNFPSLPKPNMRLEYKQKYAVIYRDNATFAFIALDSFTTKELGQVTVGDIFKPKDYRGPAKHARGNVMKDIDCVGPYGVNYLR